MPTSIKKIIANRKNCKKSTGPITNKGKLKSSLNSIKHGSYGEKIAMVILGLLYPVKGLEQVCGSPTKITYMMNQIVFELEWLFQMG